MSKDNSYVPEGYNTINPFVVVNNAEKFIEFVKKVFNGLENEYALTKDTDGLIIHAELNVGNSVILLFERKPDWPSIPALLQIYVENVESTLEIAKKNGATIITEPTDVFGVLFSRLQDPFNNIWWVWEQKKPLSTTQWDNQSEDSQWNVDSEKEKYIHDTIIQAMRGLGKN